MKPLPAELEGGAVAPTFAERIASIPADPSITQRVTGAWCGCGRELLTEKAMRNALLECLEYFEDREDVKDGDYGIPEANTEMRMAQMIRETIGE